MMLSRFLSPPARSSSPFRALATGLLAAGLAVGGTAPAALAQHAAPGTAAAAGLPVAGQAAKRSPQPVRAGDLPGRLLLRPVEAQEVLGRVTGLVRQPGGGVQVVVGTGGLLGVGARPVAVPLDTVAVLGEYLALLDLTPDQLRALPTFDPAGTMPVPPDQVLLVGLTRPFH